MTTTAIEPWVKTRDAAEFLGKPESWLHNNADRVGIPRRKLANQWRYKISQLDEWLNEQVNG